MANALTDLMYGKPSKAPVGSGMANRARETVGMRSKYDQYVVDAQENGETPIPFDKWVKQQG